MDDLQKRMLEARERLNQAREDLHEVLEEKNKAIARLHDEETRLFGALTLNLYLSWRGWPLANALRSDDDEQRLRSSLSLSNAGLSVKAAFLYALATKWHLRNEFKKAIDRNGLTRNVKTDPAIGLEVLIALKNYSRSNEVKFEDAIRDARKRAGLVSAERREGCQPEPR